MVELLPGLVLRMLLNLSQKMTAFYSPEGQKLILEDYYLPDSLQSREHLEYDQASLSSSSSQCFFDASFLKSMVILENHAVESQRLLLLGF